MKKVKLFYQKNCPHCRKALGCIDEVKRHNPELRNLEIDMIEETEQPAVADAYDYYYVPTFYVDSTKVHEGPVTTDQVEHILLEAAH